MQQKTPPAPLPSGMPPVGLIATDVGKMSVGMTAVDEKPLGVEDLFLGPSAAAAATSAAAQPSPPPPLNAKITSRSTADALGMRLEMAAEAVTSCRSPAPSLPQRREHEPSRQPYRMRPPTQFVTQFAM